MADPTETTIGRASRWSIALTIAGGLGLRIWILTQDIGRLDSDEAVTTLMAEDFLAGNLSVFFWGQDYGGSLDAVVTAAVFAVTGPSVAVAKLVMVACHAAGCLLVWRAARRWIDPRTAALGAAAAWVLSPGVVWFSTKTRGFYGAGVVLTVLVLLSVSRLLHRQAEDEHGRIRRVPGLRRLDIDSSDVVLLGIAAGLAWWTSPIVFFVVGPALVVAAVQRTELLARAGWMIGGFAVGAAPWLVVNLSKGFRSFDQPVGSEPSSYFGRIEGLFTTLLPTLVGLRRPFSGSWVGGSVGIVTAVVVLAGLTGTVFRLRKTSWIPVGVTIGFVLLFAVPSATFYVVEPRYGYMMSPFVAVLIVAALRRWPVGQWCVPLLLTVSTTVGVATLDDWAEANPGHWELNPPAVDELADRLDVLQVEGVVADYWIAYRLVVETDFLATPSTGSRRPAYDEAVARAERWAYVWYAGTPAHLDHVAALEANGTAHSADSVGPFVIVRVGPG